MNIHIGPHSLPNRYFLAPMAGITDSAFRQLCKSLGAGYTVSEMVSSRPDLLAGVQSRRRLDRTGESGLIAVQIAGTEPVAMAQAARHHVQHGAQVIDINMGCPAKKVCRQWAGSALMQNPKLALQIIEAVVQACTELGAVVTLKMRSGWDQAHKNALPLALSAEQAGVQMLTVHGRTREQGYRGQAEHHTVAAIKAAVRIPVVANGDINSPQQAQAVLAATQVDAVMIGRAALERPWIFRDIDHFMTHGTMPAPPLVADVRRWLLWHVEQHHILYGQQLGVRSVRKHIGWYLKPLSGGKEFCAHFNTLLTAEQQQAALEQFFAALAQRMEYFVGAPSHNAYDHLNAKEAA